MRNYGMVPVIFLTSLLTFVGCKENPKSKASVESSESLQKDYTEIGIKYATSTQAELGKNLMAAIQRNGTLGAMEFCNIQAYPITDSMATIHNTKLKRVSDKPRNPNNLASKDELKHIDYFKNMLASDKEYQPIVEQEKGKVHFYLPIITNQMCLQCHGKSNEQIAPTTMTAIKDLYPQDRAIGYSANEVRGIWSVVFDQEEEE